MREKNVNVNRVYEKILMNSTYGGFSSSIKDFINETEIEEKRVNRNESIDKILNG